jgi:histidinol-phosphate aminotransferase
MQKAITPNTRVVWIANPNNPTGTFVPYSEVKRFLERTPREIVVVLDEAYYEYLAPGLQVQAATWLAEHPNLIVVRTFSKIYGLAGLRVGYGIAAPPIAGLLNRVRQPFNVSGPAAAAAIAALHDQAFVSRSYRQNKAGRTQLLRELKTQQVPCLPAHGNFVAARVPRAANVYEKLLRQGVIVRPLDSYSMPDYLRVTVGTPEENERFLQAIQEALHTSS